MVVIPYFESYFEVHSSCKMHINNLRFTGDCGVVLVVVDSLVQKWCTDKKKCSKSHVTKYIQV